MILIVLSNVIEEEERCESVFHVLFSVFGGFCYSRKCKLKTRLIFVAEREMQSTKHAKQNVANNLTNETKRLTRVERVCLVIVGVFDVSEKTVYCVCVRINTRRSNLFHTPAHNYYIGRILRNCVKTGKTEPISN